LLILALAKGRCCFAMSDFPAENPRTQTRNYSYTRPLPVMRGKSTKFPYNSTFFVIFAKVKRQKN
tara:strand:- start:382 stop:576 length:195 start_codon:yes stop_codon:yes gene_type:complete